MINLIDNALKFSPAGSPVEVELVARADTTLYRILDRGPGLPADSQVLFDRFERLEGSDRVGGSGLGLWIAKNFTEAVGGTITAGNREGGGAIFEVALPVVVARGMASHA